MRIRWPLHIALMLLTCCLASSGYSDETHAKYFEQLRERGLFSLAEGQALSRLTSSKLTLADRTNFSIELSRTLTQHAGFVSDEQREELWERARSVIQDLLAEDRSNPRLLLLEGQRASVSVMEGDWLRAERQVRPFDEPLQRRARKAFTDAIEQLQAIEKRLSEPTRDAGSKKIASGSPTGFELRSLLHQTRWQLGQSFRNQAELAPSDSAERAANLSSAEQSLRRLIGVADEPLQTRARILMVTCARLKGDLSRAMDMLTAVETSMPNPIDSIADEITAERGRILMELNRPTDVVELLMKSRGQRRRLTGELWFLQTSALITLRDITLEKEQETLAERLGEQVATTIQRCEEQVGGFWSRRCRQLWDNAQTTRKYGPELDALMQKARMSFTGGRIDVALTEYLSAEAMAKKNGQTDLAMELGFTRASILLDQKQHESAASEFLRLATDYAGKERAADAHLLGAYALGRSYDEKKTVQRREAYTEALDRHLADFPHHSTVNDARFLKGQLEEQRLQASLALPLYLDVDPGHRRSLDAISGAARCYETILRRMIERHLPTDEFSREAIDRLSKFLVRKGDSVDSWTDTDADVALRLASIVMLSSSHHSDIEKKDRISDTGLRKLLGMRQSTGFEKSAEWLDRVKVYVDRRKKDPDSETMVATMEQRMFPLQVVALAGCNEITEAEQLFKTLKVSPAVLLAVMDGLNQVASIKSVKDDATLAGLQLKVAERVNETQGDFTPAQRLQLDQSLSRAYIATNQTTKAMEILKRLADASSKDVDKQRALATQLSEMKDQGALSLSRQCWRRVEALTKPGTPEWMTARLESIRTSVQLNQLEEARKLLQVTKVLYPNLGGEPLAPQFEAVERDLNSRKSSALH